MCCYPEPRLQPHCAPEHEIIIGLECQECGGHCEPLKCKIGEFRCECCGHECHWTEVPDHAHRFAENDWGDI